jgi:DNA-binding GntR family transcriptional regulator
MTLHKKDYIPFREQAYDKIKGMILKGRFSPGERITELQLCDYLGISRTPVRESIRRLAAEGLVEVNPKDGTRITELKKNDIDEIYEIRAALESLAAEKAVSRMTEKELGMLEKLLHESKKAYSKNEFLRMAQINTKFHNLISKGSKNKRLFKLIDTLCTNVTAHRALILETAGGAKESITEHEAILNALMRRDRTAVSEAVFNHVLRAKDILMEKIES